MNPKIKKFWEDAGYSISNEDQTMSGIVTAGKETKPGSGISIMETIAFGTQHRINNKWSSEEEMLRIIDLKLFL